MNAIKTFCRICGKEAIGVDSCGYVCLEHCPGALAQNPAAFAQIAITQSISFIKVKTRFVGIHQWPDCPHKQVEFLKYPHAHYFYVTAKISVKSDDRELEFFLVKNHLDEIIETIYGKDKVKQLKNNSCEMIAREIGSQLLVCYGSDRIIEVEVSEDEQSSAIVMQGKEICIL